MKKLVIGIVTLLMVMSIAACSAGLQEAADSIIGEIEGVVSNNEDSNATTTESAETSAEVTEPVAQVEINEDPGDYTWASEDEISISLDGNTASVNNPAVTIEGSLVTLNQPGTYRLNGSLEDGQLVIDIDDEGLVRLVLDGVSIHNTQGAAITVNDAEKVVVILAEDSQNTLSDGSNYQLEADSDEPNATLFSTADLVIGGEGELTVEANYNDGIASKDGLLIDGGAITIIAVDDGLRGKDYVVVRDAELSIDAGGDGIKSDEEDDASKGFITIDSGVFNIQSGGDAIAAETDLQVNAGSFTLVSGGGSEVRGDENSSAKALKAGNNLTINDGKFSINTADDGLHANNSILVNNGSFEIASADDGMHADSSLVIHDGEIMVSQSYEGLESANITINGGQVQIAASDDGINLAGGVDGSGMNADMRQDFVPGGNAGEDQDAPSNIDSNAGQGFEPGNRPPGRRGMPGGGPGMDMFAGAGDYLLTINDGVVLVDAGGDGIDSNGSIEINDGLVLVNGPTVNMNGAIDYMGTFALNGGTLVAAGSAGMAQGPDSSSTQNSVLVNFSTAQSAGTLVSLQDSQGEVLFSFAPSKPYQSLVFSLPDLSQGSYSLLLGGQASGQATFGFYAGQGTGGKEYTDFQITGVVTQLGTSGMMRR